MIMVKKENGEVITSNLMIGDSFFKRLKGLMFTKELSPESGLYIYPCSEIHTFFMNYGIDVLYLDKYNKILAVHENMNPGKIGKNVKKAVAVVELPGGKAKKAGIEVGQEIKIIKIEEELSC